MTALKLAIHTGSLPAAPTPVPLCQIGPQRHPPPGRAPCDPQLCTHTYHRPPSQNDRVDRCRDPTLRSNLHSACCTSVPYPPRFRALALFGRRPPERVVGIVGAGVRKPAHERPPALQKIIGRTIASRPDMKPR